MSPEVFCQIQGWQDGKQKTGNAIITGERRDSKNTVQNWKHKVDGAGRGWRDPFHSVLRCLSVWAEELPCSVPSPSQTPHNYSTSPLDRPALGNTTGKAQSSPRFLFGKSSKGSRSHSQPQPPFICVFTSIISKPFLLKPGYYKQLMGLWREEWQTLSP